MQVAKQCVPNATIWQLTNFLADIAPASHHFLVCFIGARLEEIDYVVHGDQGRGAGRYKDNGGLQKNKTRNKKKPPMRY